MKITEAAPSDALTAELIALSERWEAENCTHGYRKNNPEDLFGRRVFLAAERGRTVGYLFGKVQKAEQTTSVMREGTPYFELEELYVVPERRSQGIGSALFRYAENALRGEADYILLSTATKNFRAILHFYLDELGMEFWNARLYRKLT